MHLLKCVHVVVGWWNRDEFVCQLKESEKIEFWEKYIIIDKLEMKAESVIEIGLNFIRKMLSKNTDGAGIPSKCERNSDKKVAMKKG